MAKYFSEFELTAFCFLWCYTSIIDNVAQCILTKDAVNWFNRKTTNGIVPLARLIGTRISKT